MSRVKAVICPSILAADFSKLGEECLDVIAKGAHWLHIDVMDGHFVPNISIGPGVVKCLRPVTQAYFDCHLMVSDPGFWLDDFVKAGANGFTFHVEAYNDEAKTTELIKRVKSKGLDCGLSVKPDTPVSALYPFLDELDLALVMTVEPGFGGQKFMHKVLPKVQELRRKMPNLNIQVDGGLDAETVLPAAKAGANLIVAGTSVFAAKDRQLVMEKMLAMCMEVINLSVASFEDRIDVQENISNEEWVHTEGGQDLDDVTRDNTSWIQADEVMEDDMGDDIGRASIADDVEDDIQDDSPHRDQWSGADSDDVVDET